MSKTQDYGDVSVPNTRRAPNNMQKLKIKKLINMGKKCFQLAFGSVNGINSMKWWRQIIPRAGGGGAVTVNKRVMTWYVALRSMLISWKCLPKKCRIQENCKPEKKTEAKKKTLNQVQHDKAKQWKCTINFSSLTTLDQETRWVQSSEWASLTITTQHNIGHSGGRYTLWHK